MTFEDLDRCAVSLLYLTPVRVGLGEQIVRVDREDASLRVEREEHVEKNRLLLLERARERDLARELLKDPREDLFGIQRLDVTRQLALQGAPPSGCRRAARGGASRA